MTGYERMGGGLRREPYLCYTTTQFTRVRWQTSNDVRSSLVMGGGQEHKSWGVYHRADVMGLVPGALNPYTITVKGKEVYSGTMRMPPATGLVKFVVLGQTNSNGVTDSQKMIAQGIERHDPDFVCHAGQIIYHAALTDERWRYDRYYFDIYGPSISRCAWYHALGAHDYLSENGQAHWFFFDKPGQTPFRVPYRANKNYSFRVANVEIFMTDGFDPDPIDHIHIDLGGVTGPETFGGTISTEWLTAALAASTAQWKILVHNQTPYTVESTHGNELILRGLLDAIIPGEMQLVFGALSNLYHRSDYVADGAVQAPGTAPIYIMTGGGGGALNPTGPAEAWTLLQESVLHYVYCEINGADFTGTVYGRPGYFTLDSATDTITSAAHLLANDHRVLFFTTGTLPAGLSPATLYWVVGAAANTFQVSLTQGGAAVDLTAAAGSGRHMFQRRIDTWTQTA